MFNPALVLKVRSKHTQVLCHVEGWGLKVEGYCGDRTFRDKDRYKAATRLKTKAKT